MRCSRRLQKSIKPFILEAQGSRSLTVINDDTTEKLVTGACCDGQHANGDLQPFLRKTGQQQ